jgi:uncharacterized membrane protein
MTAVMLNTKNGRKMTNIILGAFILIAFVVLVYLIVTDKTTPEDEKEMLDSEEMFP